MILKINRKIKNIDKPKIDPNTGAIEFKYPKTIEVSIMGQSSDAVPTGYYIEIPEGYRGVLMNPTSGYLFGNTPLFVKTSTIGHDYKAELSFKIINHSPYPEKIQPGTTIGQLILEKIDMPELKGVKLTDRDEKHSI